MIDLLKAVAWSFLFVLRLMPLGGSYHAIGLLLSAVSWALLEKKPGLPKI